VPDLYHRIRPTLLGLLPHRWLHPENRILKPWARAVITVWVLVTVPLMAFMLLTLVTTLPRLLGTAWAAGEQDAAAVAEAWTDGGTLDVAAHALQVLAVALPVLAGLLILGRIGRRWTQGLVRWSRGSAPKRAAAVALVAVTVTALTWAWAPRPGAYRPITPGEKGLLVAALPGVQDGTGAVPASAKRAAALPDETLGATGASAQRRLGSGAPLQATFQKGTNLPTKAHPRLSVVLVPRDEPAAGQPPAEPWVFPFDKPLPPAEGDNQAAAVNTTDDSVTYDVAFALVWATGDEVLNVNEAHAYASCSNCVTVAVAFQVVLIMDDARVVVPQNLAVSANYKCYRCITAAIASQLVLSVVDSPTETKLLALGEVWGRLTEFGRSITAYTLSEISTRLEVFKAEIVAILGTAPPVGSATTTPAPGGAPTDAGASSSPETSTTPPDTASGTPDASTSAPSSATSPPASSGDSPGSTGAGSTEPTSAPSTQTPTPTPTPSSDATTDTTAPQPSP
jgi:putative peptide zinc metalloprotease protein